MRFVVLRQRFPKRLGLVVAFFFCVWPTVAADSFLERGDLWHVVHNLCVPIQQTLGLAAPCLEVNEQRGFVVIRAPGDRTRIIVVPTQKISGIESPLLLKDDAPNLWPIAWSERSRVIDAAPRPLSWDDIGMAINSKPKRTQDQLHIHVDCIDRRLRDKLAQNRNRLSGRWAELDLRPWADRYKVKRIDEAALQHDIFKLVAEELPGVRARMGLVSIAVVGSAGGENGSGFVLLVNDRGGHAEEVLDHECS